MVTIAALQWIKYRPGNPFTRVILLNEDGWKMSACASGFPCVNRTNYHFVIIYHFLTAFSMAGHLWVCLER